MAYDKIIPLRARLDHCLDYVLNEEKSSLSHALAYTENPEKSHQLVTGVNCQARTAFQEMQATKRRWDKKGGILGYHIIHSYAPGEVTPEQAHVAGWSLPAACWETAMRPWCPPTWTGSTITVTSYSTPSPLWTGRSTGATLRATSARCGAPPTP